ncbi:MAG TPA: LuxR C-terminal-related transcriptional regulator [Chloroflexia bacterium]|nr:LuxR C-terminal-related transcriptional regulator [Chloroflexia bacterium]
MENLLTLVEISYKPPDYNRNTPPAQLSQFARNVITGQQGFVLDEVALVLRAAFLSPAQALSATLSLNNLPQDAQLQGWKLSVKLVFEPSEADSLPIEDSFITIRVKPFQHEATLLAALSQNQTAAWIRRSGGPPVGSSEKETSSKLELHLLRSGQYSRCQDWLRDNVSQTSQAHDLIKQALALLVWALVKVRTKEWEAAQALANESYALGQQVSNRWISYLSLHTLRVLSEQSGNQPEDTALRERYFLLARELKTGASQLSLLLQVADAARLQGDPETSYHLLKRGLPVAEALGNPREQALVLSKLSEVSSVCRHYEESQALAEELLTLTGRAASPPSTAFLLCSAGFLMADLGEQEQAAVILRESTEYSDWLDQPDIKGSALAGLAELELVNGKLELAQASFKKSMALSWRNVNYFNLTEALTGLGKVSLAQNQPEKAQTYLSKSFQISRHTANNAGQAVALEQLAYLNMKQGQFRRAGWLLGAAAALRDKQGLQAAPAQSEALEQAKSLLSKQLGERVFKETWLKGYSLSPQEAFKRTRGAVSRVTSSKPEASFLSPDSSPAPLLNLSQRELEILNLLAMGLSNQQIAAHLALSNYTIGSYLRTIYTKLGVNSRTAAATYAIQRRLVNLS